MGKYGNGAKVGNLIVFSTEGAVKAYRVFCELFNKNMTMEVSSAMSKAADDLRKLGFSPDEIEKIELSSL